MMDTLIFLVEIAVPLAFLVAPLLFAKRVGGAAPWLFAIIAVVDAVLIFAFRAVFWMLSSAHGPLMRIDRAFNVLQLLDSAAMFGCGFLALLACLLLMPKIATR